jgi:polyisoprenoid-binding protein YceI
MMVTWVRGLLTDIHGSLEFDWADLQAASFEGVIDAARLWTGHPERDANLKSADFLDVEHHPLITFKGRMLERLGDLQGKAETDLTIRGVTRPVLLDVVYQGQWETPFWVGDENKGMLRRIGFAATAKINRHDFGVSWQGELPGGGSLSPTTSTSISTSRPFWMRTWSGPGRSSTTVPNSGLSRHHDRSYDELRLCAVQPHRPPPVRCRGS